MSLTLELVKSQGFNPSCLEIADMYKFIWRILSIHPQYAKFAQLLNGEKVMIVGHPIEVHSKSSITPLGGLIVFKHFKGELIGG